MKSKAENKLFVSLPIQSIKRKMGLKSTITYLTIIAVFVLVVRVGWYYLEHNPAIQQSLGIQIISTTITPLSTPSITTTASSSTLSASQPSTTASTTSNSISINKNGGVQFKASKDVVAAATASVNSNNNNHINNNGGGTAYPHLSTQSSPPPPPVKPVEKPIECVGNTEWCSIPMPSKSLFRFPNPPNDPVRWSKAKQAAIKEETVLLKRVLPHFPNQFDYLDGDIWFRKYHSLADAYIDQNVELRMLTNEGKFDKDGNPPVFPIKEKYKFQDHREGGKTVIPDMKDIHNIQRAPVVQLGYHAFGRGSPGDRPLLLFNGPVIGEAIIERPQFLDMWARYKDKIVLPWIGFHSANENWGILSTHFPNRTVNWGHCCQGQDYQKLMNFLNDNHTVMMVVNQHHNITHPKLITIPRGIPLHMEDGHRTMFNAQRLLSLSGKKSDFVFTSSSNWGPRPRISACVAKRFAEEKSVKFTQYGDNRAGRYTVEQYYQKLGTAKFSIALPGLGYDTHRLWESMLLGTIPVLEKGIGLDKTLWKLPALLVEDFDMITPELLRQAYLEAIYYADEFEFERLKQSYWFTFIANVSIAANPAKILEKFPVEAEDPNWARSEKVFSCGPNGSKCGKGTKRAPVTSC